MSQPDSAPVENHPCANPACGQLDDHPMIHVWGPYQVEQTTDAASKTKTITVIEDPSFHFDCLPEQFRSMVAEGDHHATTRKGIALAESGVHGDELRAALHDHGSDNEAGANVPGPAGPTVVAPKNVEA